MMKAYTIVADRLFVRATELDRRKIQVGQIQRSWLAQLPPPKVEKRKCFHPFKLTMNTDKRHGDSVEESRGYFVRKKVEINGGGKLAVEDPAKVC